MKRTQLTWAARPQGRVAVIHDYFTQLGGAERVALAMAQELTEGEMWTAIADVKLMHFFDIESSQIHQSILGSFGALHVDHRLGLPFYSAVFASLTSHAELTLCSSSAWSH